MRTSLIHASSSDRDSLLSGSCPSAHAFAPRFLQTPPHDDALALHFPSPPSGWNGDLHPANCQTCPAHTKTARRTDRRAVMVFVATDARGSVAERGF